MRLREIPLGGGRCLRLAALTVETEDGPTGWALLWLAWQSDPPAPRDAVAVPMEAVPSLAGELARLFD
jgi:hypothetical protein